MTMPWEQGSEPEFESLRLDARLGRVSLSSLQLDDEHYASFFAGQFLADIHASGHRYVDFHRGNYGHMPTGHLVIIDSGGMQASRISARKMAGDFVVPALERDDAALRALLCGYVERAYTRIEALNPGFTTHLLEALGVDRPTGDPRCTQPAREDLSRLLSPALTHATAETERLQWLRLALCLLVTAGDVEDGAAAAFLHAALGPPPPAEGGMALARWAARALRLPAAQSLAVSLLPPGGWPLAPARPSEELPYAALWPRSAVLSALVQRMDADPPAHRELRVALTQCAFLLADASSRREPARGNGSALSLASAGFLFATDGDSPADELERFHFGLWHHWQGTPAARYVSQEHGDASSLGDALLSAMFHLRAGLFEMALWGASCRDSKPPQRSACSHAIVAAVQRFRSALLLTMHATALIDDNEAVPDPLHAVASQALAAHRHAVLGINTMLVKHRVHSPYPMLWSTGVEPVVANVRWLDAVLRMLQEGPPTALRLRLALAEGKQHFAWQHLQVLTPFGRLTHSPQDIYGRREDAFVPFEASEESDRPHEED